MFDTNQSVAALVAEHPQAARILQRHKIDFCCRGERPIAEACAERGLATTELLSELERALADDGADVDLRSLPTSELVEHIVERHHGYLREALPFVGGLSAKVARVHGEHNPRLRELDEVVKELREALDPHLEDEEENLFPLLLGDGVDGEKVRRALDEMAREHEELGRLLARMRAATEDYSIPDWACGSYRGLFAELENLESDVLRHVHAENWVLKPRYAQGA